ncbi:hypothetical protein LIER_33604 [Lithospermum erythrorhizon]|uniref:Uncharacterized protein n=1 Tax=Lithospermum erythrorhizon TaxID=34254 RepID=A0AAV3S2A8_LITER
MDARVPKVWVPLEKADRLKSPPTDETFAALEKLRRIFTHKMHWKIFCKKGILIGAGLIHDNEFDLSGNPIPLGKRLIAFKKVKAVKKVASSPCPSTAVVFPPRPAPATNIAYSSPIPVE